MLFKRPETPQWRSRQLAYLPTPRPRTRRQDPPTVPPSPKHTSAYVSIRQHTPAYVIICQHMSASISYAHRRRHTNTRMHKQKQTFSLSPLSIFLCLSLHTPHTHSAHTIATMSLSLSLPFSPLCLSVCLSVCRCRPPYIYVT